MAPPTHLYVDTNIILDYLIPTRPRHGSAQRLFEHLGRNGLTTLNISALSWVEFAHVVTRQDLRDTLPEEWKQRYRLADWTEPAVRQGYLQAIIRFFEDFLQQFGWSEIAVTENVRTRALQYVALYNLDAHDSVHLASAAEAGVADLASFDRQFRRVDDLYLWNDLIYGPTPPS
jgi:predicted nucleic acid-binding protein